MNYYEILNVPVTATQEDIRIAYRKQAIKYHPDRNKGKGSEKMVEINKAYETLGNPEKRKMYDLTQPSPSSKKRDTKRGPFYEEARKYDYGNPFGGTDDEFRQWWQDMAGAGGFGSAGSSGYDTSTNQSYTAYSSSWKRQKLSTAKIKRILKEDILNRKEYESYNNTNCDLCSKPIRLGEIFFFIGERQKMCKTCQKDIASHL